MISHVVMFSMLIFGSAVADTDEGLLPLDGRWEYPHYLTFRPGNGQVCQVNSPRFSWPYVPQVVTGRGNIPAREFYLQLSRTGDFSQPEIEVHTPYNFYNALPLLEGTKWYWRVGYEVGTKEEQWSPVRSFTFAPDAVEWDRSVINEAAQLLESRAHPQSTDLSVSRNSVDLS